MLKSKKFTFILSLIIAIGLWIYVIGEINPSTDRTFKNIPVTLTYENMLRDKGLAVSSVSVEKIEVKVKGSITDIGNLDGKEIKASVNLSYLQKGENEANINIRVPDGIEVVKRSMSKIVINVEDLKEKTVPVKIKYKGNDDKNKEPVTISLKDKEVKVSGAESLINLVTGAEGELDTKKIKSVETVNLVHLKAIDNQGKPVHRIEVKPNEIKVVSAIYEVKKVKLDVPIIDNKDSENKSVKYDKEVVILGKKDILDKISYLSAEPIDITDSKNKEKFNIKITLPEGVFLENGYKDIKLTVDVKNSEEKTFQFSPKDIELINSNDELDYVIDDSTHINIVAKGTSKELKDLKKKNIKLWVDLKGLGVGKTDIALEVKSDVEGIKLNVIPENISIDINKKEDTREKNKNDNQE